MSHKIYLGIGVILASAMSIQIIFSHHGLRDLLELSHHIDDSQVRVDEIELETRQLKRQVDILETARSSVVERHVRESLGWVKPSDLIYFESSKK